MRRKVQKERCFEIGIKYAESRFDVNEEVIQQIQKWVALHSTNEIKI